MSRVSTLVGITWVGEARAPEPQQAEDNVLRDPLRCARIAMAARLVSGGRRTRRAGAPAAIGPDRSRQLVRLNVAVTVPVVALLGVVLPSQVPSSSHTSMNEWGVTGSFPVVSVQTKANSVSL
jgi:hypothetical protein